MSKEPEAAAPTDPSTRVDWRFIHPVDLLLNRLIVLRREADSAICAARTYASGHTVTDAQKGYCDLAVSAASLTRLAAYDINRWLDRGMGSKAGTFESDLRKLLRQLELDLSGLPESGSCKPILDRLLQSYEFIEDSISDLEETARDHGGEAESIWVEHLVRLPVHFDETLRDLQELVSQACDSSTALSELADRVQMRIDVLEKTLTPICARVMFLIEDSDLDVPSLNTLCNDYRRCVSDILQDRGPDSDSRRAFETSDELLHIFDQFPPDVTPKADTPDEAGLNEPIAGRVRYTLNTIPALEDPDHEWILQEEAARRTDYSLQYLKNIRSASDRSAQRAVDGCSGIDPRGQVWRKQRYRDQSIFYLKSSLSEKRSR